MIPATVENVSTHQVKIYVLIKGAEDQVLLKTSKTSNNNNLRQLEFIHGKYYENIDASSIFAAARIVLKKFYNTPEVLNYYSELYLSWVSMFQKSVISRDDAGNYKFLIELPFESLPGPVESNSKLQLVSLTNFSVEHPELCQDLNGFKKELLDATTFARDNSNFAMFDCEPDPMWVNYYDSLYYGWLRNQGENWKTYKIYNNEFPSAEECSKLKGILISGSDWNVYNTTIPEIATFLQKLRKLINDYPTIKVVGICFGSQALAQALGGSCEKMKLDSSLGPMIMGREKLIMSNGFTEKYGKKMADLTELYIAEVHGDHVSRVPDGAVIYAKSENTPIEIWGLNDNVLGFQGHPEFNASIMTKKILPEVKSQYKGRHGIDKVIDNSHRSMNSGALDQRTIFSVIDNFLKN